MSFANPIWFWAVLALLIPLFIHLFNRGKRKAIPFGSLLWLPKKNIKISRQIQLNQRWLWLIRSLILIIVAFLIAQPFILKTVQQNNPHWLLIQPNVSENLVKQLTDTLNLKQWQAKWLSYHLPLINFKTKQTEDLQKANINDILQLIDEQANKPLSVTVAGHFNAFDLQGKTFDYGFPIDWVFLPNEEDVSTLAYLKTENSLNVLSLNEQKHLTQIKKNELLEPADTNLATIQLQSKSFAVVYDASYQKLQKSILAALKALEIYHTISFKTNTYKSEDLPVELKTDGLFWLSAIEPPTLPNSTKLYLLNNSLPKETIVQNSTSEIEWAQPANLGKLPYLLNDMIFEHKTVEAQLAQIDSRPIHPSFFNEKKNGFNLPLNYYANTQQFLSYYCWFMLMLLLITERYLANRFV